MLRCSPTASDLHTPIRMCVCVCVCVRVRVVVCVLTQYRIKLCVRCLFTIRLSPASSLPPFRVLLQFVCLLSWKRV